MNTGKPYYEQDGITIYHGDCRDVLNQNVGDFDFVFTSPPYNCGMDYQSSSDSLYIQDYFDLIESSYSLSVQSCKYGAFVAWNVPSWIGSREEQVFAFDEYKSIFDRHAAFWDLVIWQKSPPNGTAWGNYPNSPRIRANHEWILIHRCGDRPLGDSDISWEDWSRLTQSVWTVNPELPYRKLHPATFPIELARRACLLFSPSNGTVLDPFCGTGTTLEACKLLGRKAVGIEHNEKYCELAANRLSQGVLFGATA